MPVSGWKVHMVWQVGPQAVTEDYYWTGAGDDPVLVIYPAALNLFKARSLLMGASVVPVTFRISQVGTFRSYITALAPDVQSVAVGPIALGVSLTPAQVAAGIQQAGGAQAPVDGSAGQANDNVIVDIYSTTANHAKRFLGGVPDVMERTNPLGPWIVGVPSWKSAFDAWVTLLTNTNLKWAFRARVQPTAGDQKPQQVVKVQLDPTGTTLWQIEVGGLSNAVGAGSSIQLRGFKMTSRALISWNGTYTVKGPPTTGADPGTSWYTLLGTSNLSSSLIAVYGNARVPDVQLYAFKSITAYKQGTHKRGNRVLASPGRRRVVQRVYS